MSTREHVDLAEIVGDVEIACDFKCERAATHIVRLYRCCPKRPRCIFACLPCLSMRLEDERTYRCRFECGFTGRPRDWVTSWEPIDSPAK